jgi:hypothetical protein
VGARVGTARVAHGAQSRRRTTARAAASSALLLEVDGALCDLHQDGHRQAFNKAFHSLGYDCANCE